MNKSNLTPIIFFVLLLAFVSCGGGEEEKEAAPPSRLQFIKSHKLEIPEPSGIAFDISDSTLWIVSDHNSTVYKTNLEGKVISSFTVDGEDLEGITCLQQSFIAVVLERTREVQYLYRDGKLRFKKKLNISGELNSGLEGIGYSNKDHIFYIVNEKNPRVLMGYNDSMHELFRDTLRFAKDLSGVCYDDSTQMLWLVSDDSRSLYLLNKHRQLIGAFPLNIKQLEGVAFDPATKRLYLVSDLLETLFVYELHGSPNMEKREEPTKQSVEGGSQH